MRTPRKPIDQLSRLIERWPNLEAVLTSHPDLAPRIQVLAQASDFLPRLLSSDPIAPRVLRDLDSTVGIEVVDAAGLARWKRLELLRIAARDLCNIDNLEAVGANLALLAGRVLSHSVRLADAEELVVVGMGKLGGGELNYASDIDIMFVGPPSAQPKARHVMEIARKCFRVDAALRPEGRDGPLVRTLESYEIYWDKWAKSWEFQALLKARVVTGESELAKRWTEAADSQLWSHKFDAGALHELREMKRRSEGLVEQRGLADREVKRGRGGIRDVEFAAQLLQLVHGGADPDIRSKNTLDALERLAARGYIDAEDAETLGTAYRFFRNVEHRLQLVEEEQTHTIPTDRPQRERLAHTMGFADTQRSSALDTFDSELRIQQATVRGVHERLYFRPLLEAFAGKSALGAEAVKNQLQAFGFTDAQRTREAVVELTEGLTRSSHLMRQMMPLLLDWLSQSPDPNAGLLGLRKLIAGFRTPSIVVKTFRDSPEAARRLCLLLGTGPMFATGFNNHPELLAELGRSDVLSDSSTFTTRARSIIGDDPTQASRDMQRFVHAELVRIAATDVLGLTQDVRAARTLLAETTVRLALENWHDTEGIAVIAMGRFGGGELAYGSDLDMLVVYDGGDDRHRNADEFAQHLAAFVSGPPSPQRIYQADFDLRPEGKKGPLARSIDACRNYYGNWAATWERQALVRARPVTGADSVARGFMQIVADYVWSTGLKPEEKREIRHLKARMERERVPRVQDATFNLKLGPGTLSDVEWTVQLLQLDNQVVGASTVSALRDLEVHGFLDSADAETLRAAWEFCDHIRNRLFLVDRESGDALPTNATRLTRLAYSLDTTPSKLRETYMQLTRRARAATERLFYGTDSK